MAVLEGVEKSFQGEPLLRGLDLEARAGEVTVVLGGSGGGKSTTLRILLGLESYDAGSVRLLGREVRDLGRVETRELMMQVGMLFQFGALFDSMTVEENVGFALRHTRGWQRAEIADLVRETLLMVGLKDIQGRYPSELSGGMRKRVALARGIAHNPRLLLVDEPTTGLDPIMADTISELILQMRDRLGVTVLCITHDLGAAFKIADRIAFLYQGRVIESGSPDELRASTHEVVRQFLSGSAHGPIHG
ncbi:MAG: ABC transporter ATP-binding protein [Deltaproteobacteria bacterium]|jgi:phospholipid/cholesterol/gamma-HCH transport system ATP-binding protein|nr:ABC transporter ATP-binding protein [Deltaproteobacteria bacterium]